MFKSRTSSTYTASFQRKWHLQGRSLQEWGRFFEVIDRHIEKYVNLLKGGEFISFFEKEAMGIHRDAINASCERELAYAVGRARVLYRVFIEKIIPYVHGDDRVILTMFLSELQ